MADVLNERKEVSPLIDQEQQLHQVHQQDSWVNRLVTDSTQQKEKAAESAKSLLSVGSDCYNGPLQAASGSGILGAVGTAVSTGSTILRGTARGEDDEESEPGEAVNSAVGFAGKKLRKRGRGRDSAERSGEFPGNKWYEARLKYAKSWYEYAQSHWLSASGATGTAADILEACQKLANIVYADNNWHYDTTHYGSFSAARNGSRKMDCAKYVSYVLQDIGILSSGQTFYSSSGGSIKWKGKNTQRSVKRRCEIIPVGKKVKDCGSILQPGDICGMTRHICIYSDTKDGDMYWWSAGTGACKKGKFKWLYKHYPSYQGRHGAKGQTIHYIIRAKG